MSLRTECLGEKLAKIEKLNLCLKAFTVQRGTLKEYETHPKEIHLPQSLGGTVKDLLINKHFCVVYDYVGKADLSRAIEIQKENWG